MDSERESLGQTILVFLALFLGQPDGPTRPKTCRLADEQAGGGGEAESRRERGVFVTSGETHW